ncbi:hypothetical protein [Candidatus Ichthyocystis hellenicum]|nr:hypothetical protein [Candidatus Ichthyocystis hellenicum]
MDNKRPKRSDTFPVDYSIILIFITRCSLSIVALSHDEILF